MPVQAFNYEIAEFSFAGGEINRNYIKSIVIESLYESRTMATMYVYLHLPSELYQSILNAEKTEEGFINLTMRSRNVYSETSLANDYISGRYVYVLPTSNPDYSVNLSGDEDKSYKSLVLALLDNDYLDKMKTSLTGTYYKVDIQDLLRLALKDMRKVVVQPPTVENLKKFDKIVIPPMNNMNKMIAYLYNLKPFYNTAYTFFADFSNVYLIAHDKETSGAIGAVSRVVFHVNSVTSDAAYIEGVVPGGGSNYIEGDTYHVYLNPADISVSPNKGIDFISNEIMSVDETGKVTEPIKLELGLLSSASEYAKLAVRRGTEIAAQIAANMFNSNTVLVEFKKSHIDGSLIAPDKVITINFELSDDKEEFNTRYSGDYYLTYKREIISNVAGTFAVSCAVGLKKIGNLISVADASAAVKSSGGISGLLSREGTSGSNKQSQASSSYRVGQSSYNASNTQSTLGRVGSVSVSSASPTRQSVSNPYNLKVKSYKGPEFIDTKSSGAVVLFEPHVNESKIRNKAGR